MEKATIKDVAKEANVSIATVSNVLNGSKKTTEKTKEKVLTAVEKLDYVPNLNGRYLKSTSSKMIGFFTNSIAGPYFCLLIEAMAKRCELKGYGLNVFCTKSPKLIMENTMGKSLDGVIIFEDLVINNNEIELFEKADIKMVFLDREKKGKGSSSVLFDSYKAGYDATKHLINLGHKKIAFIECVDQVIDSLRRKEGYLAALKEYNLLTSDIIILQGGFEKEFTYNSVKNFIRHNNFKMPDAFLAGNDLSAFGCIKALNSEGYSVPEDVSVMGFDDIEISKYFCPKLTTVNNPFAQQGMLAAETVLNLISGKELGSIKRLEGKLVIRDSCTMKK